MKAKALKAVMSPKARIAALFVGTIAASAHMAVHMMAFLGGSN